jgi:hypothetical protein
MLPSYYLLNRDRKLATSQDVILAMLHLQEEVSSVASIQFLACEQFEPMPAYTMLRTAACGTPKEKAGCV